MRLLTLLFIFLTSFNVFALSTSTRSEIKISIEDTTNLSVVDFDGNDVAFCSNWQYESDTDDLLIHRATLSITPIAAGAVYPNSIYIRNLCNGPAEIELKKPEDTCGADSTIETVAQGGMLLWTTSFTENAFSSNCSTKEMINVRGNEMCSPNKSWVVIECLEGSSIDLTNEPNNEFPFAKIFHVDALANGTEAGKDADDVNSDTLFGGIATIIVGHCDDPVPEERVNIIDALNVRGSLSNNDCTVDAQTCRNAIKNILSSHRTMGWSNIENIRERKTPKNHGIDFTPRPFIANNMFSRRNGNAGRRKNPIFNEDINECSSENNQDSYIHVVTPNSISVPSVFDNQDIAGTYYPAAARYIYNNRSDSSSGRGIIGVGPTANAGLAVFNKPDFSRLTRTVILPVSAWDTHANSYCVYNASECPSGIQSFQNGAIDFYDFGGSPAYRATWSSEFFPIAADPVLGTDAFCISKELASPHQKERPATQGSRIFNLCKGHTTASAEEKSKYAMITWEQYNALVRNWEQVDDNWSGGSVGVGNILMSSTDGYEDLLLSRQTSGCSQDQENFLTLKTKNGDRVRNPIPLLYSCSVWYIAPFIADFSGDDNSFTYYTEDLPNRSCTRVTNYAGGVSETMHRIAFAEGNDGSRAGQLEFWTQNGSTSIIEYITPPPGASNKTWLHTDQTITVNGVTYPVTPGSKCPIVNTINDYVFY